MPLNVEQVQKVGVVGAGTMGSGIAQIIAQKGIEVELVDVSDKALERGLAGIEKSLGRLVKKDKLKQEDVETITSRINSSTTLESLSDVDLVVEAVFEEMGVKKATYEQLTKITKPDVVLATNTSSLPIIDIAMCTDRPDKVVGMHFFNPAPVMSLVEIIEALTTSPEVLQFAYDFAGHLGKEPVKTKDYPGFIVNRILIPMLNEAVFTLQDGIATAEDIDKAMKLGTNHPIGPLALIDLIGLDVTLDVMDVFYTEFKDSKYRPSPLLRQMVRAGWLGRKSGKGFYDYA